MTAMSKQQAHTSSPDLKAAAAGLAVLTLLNLFNYIDRYLVSALVETLKHSELQLSDAQAGLLMTAFIAVYTLVFPIFGFLGDRYSRPKLLAFSVLLWSIATMLSGIAPSFHWLLLSRALVGVGEAAYVTVAPTLIADYFPDARRGKAFAIFFAAIPIGSAIGYILGGVLDSHFGWRSAFLFTGLPGLILTGLAFLLPNPPATAAPAKLKLRGALTGATYLWSSLGYAAYAFGLGGLAFWMPSYMERVRHASHEDAAMITGGLVVATGFIGTFAGGWLADRMRRRHANADLIICWTSALTAVPLLGLAFYTASTSLFWISLAAGELALFMSSGPINGAIIATLPAAVRAMGLAVCNVITHILGDVPSPTFIGWVSDRSSLLQALSMIPAALLVAAVLWAFASRSFLRTQPQAVEAARV